MTIKDVAETCQLSESAVRRAIDEGELLAVKLRSRLRIERSAFDAWITSQRRPAARPSRSMATPPRAPRRAPSGTFRALIQADSARPTA